MGSPNLVSAFFDMLMSRWLDDETIAQCKRAEPPAGASPPATDAKGEIVQPAPFQAQFRGRMLMLLGETTKNSGKYRVTIDGKLVRHRDAQDRPLIDEFDGGKLGRAVGGNAHLSQVIAEGLDPDQLHTLKIEPVFETADQELRLESICVAGPKTMVEAAR